MVDLKEYFKKKYLEGYKGYEIVIALLALIKENKITENDIIPIMNYVYDNNFVEVYNALNMARALVDDELIDDILKEVEKNK